MERVLGEEIVEAAADQIPGSWAMGRLWISAVTESYCEVLSSTVTCPHSTMPAVWRGQGQRQWSTYRAIATIHVRDDNPHLSNGAMVVARSSQIWDINIAEVLNVRQSKKSPSPSSYFSAQINNSSFLHTPHSQHHSLQSCLPSYTNRQSLMQSREWMRGQAYGPGSF